MTIVDDRYHGGGDCSDPSLPHWNGAQRDFAIWKRWLNFPEGDLRGASSLPAVVLRVIPPSAGKEYAGFVPIKVREIIQLLEEHGWRHVRTTGDHRVFRSPDGRITVVSGKAGDVFDRAPTAPF